MTNYSSGDHALTEALTNSYQKTDPTRFCYQTKPAWKPHDVSEVKINYVIATWSGYRRQGNEQLNTDPCFYLKKQLQHLAKYGENISQITIMVPENPTEPEAFTHYLNEIQGDKVKVLRRENFGQSYGSWLHSFKTYRSHFDYYIFIEDDYLPVISGFDQILVSMFQKSENCGYLCTRVDKYPPTNYMGRPHAAISNGITSSEVLAKIEEKLDGLKFSQDQFTYAATPQLEFSWMFLDSGYWLYDYSNHYSAPYHNTGKLQHYGSSKLPALFFPVQFT